MSLAKRLELAEKRGRLSARIQAQREALAQQSMPLADTLAIADRGIALVDAAKQRLQRQPALAAAAVALLFIFRPRRMLRWSRRAWLTWQTFSMLRQRIKRF